MPIVSQAQRGFLHAKHPGIAKHFESETPAGKKLPYKVGSDGKGPLHHMFGKGKKS